MTEFSRTFLPSLFDRVTELLPARLRRGTAVVPVVSISSAPAGGHSPAGGHGSIWPGDATGVADATTTGVMETLRPTSVNDTGRLRFRAGSSRIFDMSHQPSTRSSDHDA